MAFEDFGGDLLVTDNGPGDELGEQGDVEGQVEGVTLGACGFSIDIDDVGHGLKGEKGNADGKVAPFQHEGCGTEEAQEIVEVVDEEGAVLVEGEELEIDQNAEYQGEAGILGAPCAIDPESEAVVERDGAQHDEHKGRLTPGIEKKACGQQPIIAGRPGAQKVRRKDHRQKKKQEDNGTENHGLSDSFISARRNGTLPVFHERARKLYATYHGSEMQEAGVSVRPESAVPTNGWEGRCVAFAYPSLPYWFY